VPGQDDPRHCAPEKERDPAQEPAFDERFQHGSVLLVEKNIWSKETQRKTKIVDRLNRIKSELKLL
jgi:hypothetical protein